METIKNDIVRTRKPQPNWAEKGPERDRRRVAFEQRNEVNVLTPYDLLRRLQEAASTPQQRGELFERFVAEYLRRDKYYSTLFSNVWRWSDWPGRSNLADYGIDIVAEEKDSGNLWAIQVKFHESKLDLNDIATFLTVSGQKLFSKRMLVTASALTKTAENALYEQEKPVVVLMLTDILQAPIDWNSFTWSQPEQLDWFPEKPLRPYQAEAVDAVVRGFTQTDRGRLIMPPGSGKTFTALRIAERLVGKGGHVLFLAPSIALVEQTLRSWLDDAAIPLRVFAVTSDRSVGRDSDSLDRVTVLSIPPTTNADDLAGAASKGEPDCMTVIVSTYHSIDVVSEAQQLGLPDFDLIVADEAHRTTGVMQADGEDYSYYLKVHDNGVVKGAKRLYMTATPRIFVPKLKSRLEEAGFDFYSMDDVNVYGEEFYRLGFGEAVDLGFLSDYRVVVFTITESEVQSRLFEFLNRGDTPPVEEATKIVGVWAALNGRIQGGSVPPLKRAVVFSGRIAESKRFAEQFRSTTEAYEEATGMERSRRFEVRHIDGSMSATDRKTCLDWLREPFESDEVRILSNARVLTEGIDVPALDAVVFLRPRRSVVDVVQAVGRAMRRAPGKRYGYVILPVIVNPDADAAEQLDKNEEFRTVWEVLGALRSIDDRFDATVRELAIRQLRERSSVSEEASDYGDDVIIIGPGERTTQQTWDFAFEQQLRTALFGKLVERVGDRKYLETLAKDVANVTLRLERHIKEALVHNSEFGEQARQAFSDLVTALQSIINPTVTEDDARGFLVQHIVTKPVFDALFEGYSFLKENPIAQSLDRVAAVFESFVQKETKTLENFYRQVRVRARGIDKETERQDFLRELYDVFFRIAFPGTAEQLGVVYTPVEVVDFLVYSAEAVLREEFGLSLSDENVVILEPFAGTGTFLARIMHIISRDALVRKYASGELWGNEILLLPYYIALANVESTYYALTGNHEPFEHLLLVDSFQLMETGGIKQLELFPEQYTELMQKERDARVNVIVSNPPWFAWQEDENRGIKAVKYEKLDEAIGSTYAASSSAQLKNSLYDSYIRAIRMATDRLGRKGAIAFVTNNGFLDGRAADGLRKHLAGEFSKIYVLNLRGNGRTSGERRRQEGDGIFDQGSRAGVALLVLVKDDSKPGPANIYYHDIGDYLSRETKFERLRQYGDIKGVEWTRIVPNSFHDWINQRSEQFANLPVLGSKTRGESECIFSLYSGGLKTSRDVWAYNFSHASLTANMQRLIGEFNRHVELVRSNQLSRRNIDQKVNNDPRKIAWSSGLKSKVLAGRQYTLGAAGVIVPAMYRPFVKSNVYYSRVFNERLGRLPSIFPEPGMYNIAICVPGPGNTKGFSVLAVDMVPDLHLIGDTQVFPLYSYDPLKTSGRFDGTEGEDVVTGPSGTVYRRRVNITDWALAQYRSRYGDSITAEDVFHYVYGVLHSPAYSEQFTTDLMKSLPRIPFVASGEDFWAFSRAGRELIELHLGYESVDPWPLEEKIQNSISAMRDCDLYRTQRLTFKKLSGRQYDKSTIIYNEFLYLTGIPAEAYDYVVNGLPAVEWLVERYRVTEDSASEIVNDPNRWMIEQQNPRYLVDLVKRVVRVSMETRRIVAALPELRIAE